MTDEDLRELLPSADEQTQPGAAPVPTDSAELEALLDELREARRVVVLEELTVPQGLLERTLREALADRDVRHEGRSVWSVIDAWVSRLGAFAMRPQAAMGMLLLIMVGSSLLFLRAKPGGPGSVRIREVGEPSEDAKAAAKTRPQAAAAPAPAASAAPAPTAAADEPKEDAAYATAMEDFKAKRFAEAIRGFDIVAQGGGANASHASLYAARAARFSGGCGGAIVRFESTSRRYAGTGVAMEASWDAAVCYRELGQLDQARLMFETLKNTGAYRERAEREIATIDQRRAGPGNAGEAPPAGAKAGGVASPKSAPAKPASR